MKEGLQCLQKSEITFDSDFDPTQLKRSHP